MQVRVRLRKPGVRVSHRSTLVGLFLRKIEQPFFPFLLCGFGIVFAAAGAHWLALDHVWSSVRLDSGFKLLIRHLIRNENRILSRFVSLWRCHCAERASEKQIQELQMQVGGLEYELEADDAIKVELRRDRDQALDKVKPILIPDFDPDSHRSGLLGEGSRSLTRSRGSPEINPIEPGHQAEITRTTNRLPCHAGDQRAPKRDTIEAGRFYLKPA